MQSCIILGSGRSGTSLMCGLLNKAGYYMGEGIIAPDRSNPKGYFESLEINRLNEDILAHFVPPRAKGFIGNVFFPRRTIYMQRWLSAIPSHVKISAGKEIGDRIRAFTSRKPFCFKDPRFSYTLPVWMKHMDDSDVVYVCIFRQPTDVMASMVKEAMRDAEIRNVKLQFGEKEAMSVWRYMYAHILKAFHADTRKHKWMFLSYEQVISGDKKLALLEEKLGVALDRDFVNAELNHGKTASGQTLSPPLEVIFNELHQLSNA